MDLWRMRSLCFDTRCCFTMKALCSSWEVTENSSTIRLSVGDLFMTQPFRIFSGVLNRVLDQLIDLMVDKLREIRKGTFEHSVFSSMKMTVLSLFYRVATPTASFPLLMSECLDQVLLSESMSLWYCSLFNNVKDVYFWALDSSLWSRFSRFRSDCHLVHVTSYRWLDCAPLGNWKRVQSWSWVYRTSRGSSWIFACRNRLSFG